MNALIITDGTELIGSIALRIEETLEGYKVKICSADNFAGNDLLPADIFFLGCENPSPSSFAYLEEMLAHINLASRKCGVFSVKEKSIKYLAGILKDSEADCGEPLLFKDGEIKKAALKKWLNSIK
ncbi:MAG: hypothetical protein FWB83_02855 [Treponema sp.]|nr:hypothetical protein [Treponema sp.]